MLRAIEPGSASSVALSYRGREECMSRVLHEHSPADGLLACNEIGIQRPPDARGGIALPEAAYPATRISVGGGGGGSSRGLTPRE